MKNKAPKYLKGADGSPIETRCQARGMVAVDRKKARNRNRCRRKGRANNPRNAGY
jgi:hypothetical protein